MEPLLPFPAQIYRFLQLPQRRRLHPRIFPPLPQPRQHSAPNSARAQPPARPVRPARPLASKVGRRWRATCNAASRARALPASSRRSRTWDAPGAQRTPHGPARPARPTGGDLPGPGASSSRRSSRRNARGSAQAWPEALPPACSSPSPRRHPARGHRPRQRHWLGRLHEGAARRATRSAPPPGRRRRGQAQKRRRRRRRASCSRSYPRRGQVRQRRRKSLC
mmetsp:Transcript_40591/g.65117  ORF Transcript_40591/g.65117 Transcript_40591/m.65117 type:complete len:222 (+) Transcript_40591:1563-2228(+)